MLTRLCLVLTSSLGVVVPLGAQQPDSGTVNITVREAMGMVDGILVRSEARSVTTDASGRARLVLPAGRRQLLLTRIGFVPKRLTVTVIADSIIAVTVDVAMEGMMPTMEAVRISVTRLERLVEKTPLRVEGVDEMEVDENTLMAPSDLTMLLNNTPGLRVQRASPTLGTGSVPNSRIGRAIHRDARRWPSTLWRGRPVHLVRWTSLPSTSNVLRSSPGVG